MPRPCYPRSQASGNIPFIWLKTCRRYLIWISIFFTDLVGVKKFEIDPFIVSPLSNLCLSDLCPINQPVSAAKQVHYRHPLQSGRSLSRAQFSGVQIQWSYRNNRTRLVVDTLPGNPPGRACACHEHLF
jgi:hypothetical protein